MITISTTSHPSTELNSKYLNSEVEVCLSRIMSGGSPTRINIHDITTRLLALNTRVLTSDDLQERIKELESTVQPQGPRILVQGCQIVTLESELQDAKFNFTGTIRIRLPPSTTPPRLHIPHTPDRELPTSIPISILKSEFISIMFRPSISSFGTSSTSNVRLSLANILDSNSVPAGPTAQISHALLGIRRNTSKANAVAEVAITSVSVETAPASPKQTGHFSTRIATFQVFSSISC